MYRYVCMCVYIYVCVCVCVHIYIYGGIYYKVLAHVIMKTENSPDLSAICKLQTQESQCSKFQSNVEGLRIRSTRLRAGED